MYDFFRFKITEDEELCRLRMYTVLKKLNVRAKAPLKMDIEKKGNDSFCVLKVDEEWQKEYNATSFPIYLLKYGKKMHSTGQDIVFGVKKTSCCEVPLSVYICGYISKGYMQGLNTTRFETKLTNSAFNYRKKYDKTFTDDRKVNFKVLNKEVVIDNKSYYPIYFSCSPQIIAGNRSSVSTTDFRNYLKRWYSSFNQTITRIVRYNNKQVYLRADIAGNPMPVTNSSKYLSKYEVEKTSADAQAPKN